MGGLRIQVADRFDAQGEFDGHWADAATDLTDAAELESERTCECCGAPGRPASAATATGPGSVGSARRAVRLPCPTGRGRAPRAVQLLDTRAVAGG
ncbi:hypothetical protein NKH77_03790 [Streptomyces sp. M19]